MANATVEHLKSLFPRLADVDFDVVVTPEQRAYKLETWMPGDPGSKTYKRPSGAPLDALTIQVFQPEGVTPKMIYADIASHWLRKRDSNLNAMYRKFVESITPDQKKRLAGDYKWARENTNTDISFMQWKKQVRIPAYFRGYVFNQWPDEFTDKVFTQKQRKILNQARAYLGLSEAP